MVATAGVMVITLETLTAFQSSKEIGTLAIFTHFTQPNLTATL